MGIQVGDCFIETTEAGYLVNLESWTEMVAEAMAKNDSITLTEAHWEIIHFIRNYYYQFNHLPNSRMFVRALGAELGHEKGNSHYLYRLFPDGPLKYACKFAGLPRPTSCI